jgi:hypothetical protein
MQNKVHVQPKNPEEAPKGCFIRPMTLEDIPMIVAIEEVSFPHLDSPIFFFGTKR